MSARTNVRGRRRDAKVTLALYVVSGILVAASLYAAFGWWNDPEVTTRCGMDAFSCFDRTNNGGGTFLIRLFGGVLLVPIAGLLYLAARGGEPVRTLRTAQAGRDRAQA
jgi:hypothetical protein